MGQLHWSKHALKAPAVKEVVLNSTFRLVVRERPVAPGPKKFSATVVFRKPPVPGRYVKAVDYGSTAEKAERNVMEYMADVFS